MYNFGCDPVWRVHKVDIKASHAELAAAEPLTLPTKLSASMIDLNENYVDKLINALVTELTRRRRHSDVTSASKEDIVPGS